MVKMMDRERQRFNDASDDLHYRREINGIAESEWTALVDRFQDANIYQTWSYGAVRWGEKHLSHLVLRRNDEAVAIAQLRVIRFPFFRSGVAYLRWGPLCQLRGREFEPEILRQMAVALYEEYVRKRGLLLRVLPNAFAGSQRAQVFQTAFSRLAMTPLAGGSAEKTFLLDLSPSLEELRKKLDPKWRNKLSGAERNGLEVIEGEGTEEYGTFLKIYEQMWQRKRFETTVNVEEFARIQETLPKAQRMWVLIGKQNNTPVAGIVCSAMGNSGIYLLGATSDVGLKAKGAYLLQWTMIKWLKENGFQYYDLGGIDPERNLGVYQFKRGFSGREVAYIGPITLCENPFSSLLMRAGDRVRRWRQGTLPNRSAQERGA